LRPVERKAIADQPFPEVGIAHCTDRNGPSVLIQRDRDAAHQSTRDEGIEIVRGFRAAAILLAVVAPAELGSLGRVDAPKADACAVNFERVAVDDAGRSSRGAMPHRLTREATMQRSTFARSSDDPILSHGLLSRAAHRRHRALPTIESPQHTDASEHRRAAALGNEHKHLHRGPPFLGIVLCLGQFRDVEPSVARGDQRFPARQYDRTGPGSAPESWGLLLRSRMRTDTFVKAGSSVAISPFADMLRIVGRSKEEALSLGSAP